MSGSFAPPSTSGSANWAVPGTIGSTTPNTGSFTSLTSSGNLIEVPRSTQTVVAATSIATSARIVPITATAPVTLTSNPQIATGSNGQRVTIINVGSNAVTFVNGNGLILPQSYILYGGRSISFTYISTYSSWVIDGIIPESLSLTGAPTVATAGYGTATTQIASTQFVDNATKSRFIEAARPTSQTLNATSVGQTFTIIYSTEYNDLGNQHNTTTGQVTITSGNEGSYIVTACCTLSGITGSGRFIFGIYKNGTERRLVDRTFASGEFPFLNGTIPLRLAIGDVVDARVIVMQVGNYSTFADGNINYLHMEKV